MPPLWITVILHQMVLIFAGYKLRWSSLALYLLDIQGLNRIFVHVNLPTFLGMGQTWFITVIMVCYVLMAILKNSRAEVFIDCHCFLFIAAGMQVILAYFGLQIAYLLQFFIGYFLARKNLWDKDNYDALRNRIIFVCVTLAMATLLAMRLILHKIIDGSVLYDMVVSRWSFNILALWIVFCVQQLNRSNPYLLGVITGNKLWDNLDQLSYPLFLTHYMFLKGELSVEKWMGYSGLQTIIFIFLTIIVGIIINYITNRFNDFFRSKTRNMSI